MIKQLIVQMVEDDMKKYPHAFENGTIEDAFKYFEYLINKIPDNETIIKENDKMFICMNCNKNFPKDLFNEFEFEFCPCCGFHFIDQQE